MAGRDVTGCSHLHGEIFDIGGAALCLERSVWSHAVSLAFMTTVHYRLGGCDTECFVLCARCVAWADGKIRH